MGVPAAVAIVLLGLVARGARGEQVGWARSAAAPAPEAAGAGGLADTVALAFHDPTGALELASSEVGAEVRRAFDALGARLAWRAAASGSPTFPGELQVILLGAGDARGRLGASTMGAVVRGEGAGRALWLFLPAIERTLGLARAPGRRLAADQRRLLARALGRVVAHETVHLFAPRQPHARRGLMAERLTRAELTRDAVAVDDESRRAFLTGLAQGAGPAAWRRDAQAGGTPRISRWVPALP